MELEQRWWCPQRYVDALNAGEALYMMASLLRSRAEVASFASQLRLADEYPRERETLLLSQAQLISPIRTL